MLPSFRLSVCLMLVCGLGACAPTAPGLSAVEQAEIRTYAPNADLSNLTPAQVGALSNALHSGDGFDIPAQIYAILNPYR
ncbi:hypothetical protein Q9295_11245 [Xinfangfangia sp. CPCC 101601]|uniref:Uncharacterized protein n=1 Tax=Pseudogemmobacter lacusdianii TaxID=3069608 RepID=A0ABU0VYX2_9RHOB|nr:hypothetical protein [Xinfangfangia sp. CPCC 101601]MDQ2066952.1 hypothetical protein [Xinfangfangia sp. CPCC 101601]